MQNQNEAPGFDQMQLSAPIQKALKQIGYEQPTPIQQEIIPHLLAGVDVVGQAQTGTGKTAAFALPLLTQIDLKQKLPQILVLAPTRELAIQVSEAFKTYASQLKSFRVVPVYGGQSYDIQLKQLRRNAHVVVGTPGRVMDYIDKGELVLSELKCLVLDEADEMLRMGFLDDVEWILKHTPSSRQTALFSATMASGIRRIAENYLKDAVDVRIKVRTAAAETIRQRYLPVRALKKLDALTRILEGEVFDGMIVFVRTRIATIELTEKLEARGFEVAALNGDIAQKQREATINRFKQGKFDILVATDVAARGLDVDRVSHIVNYDIPYDTESYVHRVGRTGRAGKTGEAILFVTHREKRLLASIERVTKQRIERMKLPSAHQINDRRIAEFRQKITDTLMSDELELYLRVIDEYSMEFGVPPIDVAAALARMYHGEKPFLVSEKMLAELSGPEEYEPRGRRKRKKKPGPELYDDSDKETFRIEVGKIHEIKASNIVGAIANEAGIGSEFIGKIKIYDDFSTIDLPKDLPKALLSELKRVRVGGQKINISRMDGKWAPPRQKRKESAKARKKKAIKKHKRKKSGK